MKITKIQQQSFRNTQALQAQKEPRKPEFIDKVVGVIQNQSDVNDCVAVPRGIFKAYLWIMGGAGVLGIANVLPDKLKAVKSPLIVIGNIMYILSAFFLYSFCLKITPSAFLFSTKLTTSQPQIGQVPKNNFLLVKS